MSLFRAVHCQARVATLIDLSRAPVTRLNEFHEPGHRGLVKLLRAVRESLLKSTLAERADAVDRESLHLPDPRLAVREHHVPLNMDIGHWFLEIARKHPTGFAELPGRTAAAAIRERQVPVHAVAVFVIAIDIPAITLAMNDAILVLDFNGMNTAWPDENQIDLSTWIAVALQQRPAIIQKVRKPFEDSLFAGLPLSPDDLVSSGSSDSWARRILLVATKGSIKPKPYDACPSTFSPCPRQAHPAAAIDAVDRCSPLAPIAQSLLQLAFAPTLEIPDLFPNMVAQNHRLHTTLSFKPNINEARV
jgi:hypothetical protein